MTATEISRIQSQLGVNLPGDYKTFLLQPRTEFDPDETALLDDSESIIDLTRKYRRGFYGLKPWPGGWVYLGDESDACPYALDCGTGELLRLDKGNRDRAPLARHENFATFLESYRADLKRDAESEKLPETFRDKLLFYTPALAGLLIIFVIIPLAAFSISHLFKWLFR